MFANVSDMVIDKIIQFQLGSIKRKDFDLFNTLLKNLNSYLNKMNIYYTSAFCTKYETLSLSFSIAILSNPINKFIRYITTKSENKTIIITSGGFSIYDQLVNALESPSNNYIN